MDVNTVMLQGYMSHAIRGRKGEECSWEEMKSNCANAAQTGAQLMALFQRWGLPVYLYVPGMHDEFVRRASRSDRITIKEILDTDLEIISECDFLLVYDWENYLSRGMKVEVEYAETKGIPCLRITKLDQLVVWQLQNWLTELLLAKVDTPNIIQIHGGDN